MKLVDTTLFEKVSGQAKAGRRLRANFNLHPTLQDPVQRFLNAMEPGTYVRPHRHPGDRWELFLALQGALAVLVFDDGGVALDRVELREDGPVRAVEVPPGAWHTVASLEPGSVLFELKPGPYLPLTDKDFAPWAPQEGAGSSGELASQFGRAMEGDCLGHR